MGREPQWDDVTYGDDCLFCFAPDLTPDKVQVNFSGVAACGGWGGIVPAGSYVLPQSPGAPCFWTAQFGPGAPNLDGTMIITLQHLAIQTWLIAQSLSGHGLFVDIVNAPCSDNFVNELACPGDMCGGGTAVLEWGNIADKIINQQNFGTGGKNLYEKTDAPDHNEVYRTASRFDKTCCYIKHLLSG